MVFAKAMTVWLMTAAAAAQECNEVELDFVVLEGETTHRAIEDDIRADLAVVGITATARFLEKEDFNTAMVDGDYDLVFSETWGAPYDPHSYVNSWTTPDEAHYPVLETLDPPMDPENFEPWVDAILQETDEATRQANWTTMLSTIHERVIHLPLWGKRIPSVVARRLSGYLPGPQQFDYPIVDISVDSGSKNVTVAPGAQTGLFASVGPMDAHGYRPNEFFSNNWIYEGLVSYGHNGNIEASLASDWTSETKVDGGEKVWFTIREGVKFHDGTDFNCSVVKLNFDHVYAGPLTGSDWHGWYGLPGALSNWYCEDETFILETAEPYYPLLQELTYIRPLRMVSAAAFAHGISTSPYTHNSCPSGWGTIENPDGPNVTCVGISAPIGTGPFSFLSRTLNDDEDDDEVIFKRFADYWGAQPDIEFVKVVRYDTAADVLAALEDGSLDAVLGAGVLEPSDLQDLLYSSDFDVEHSEATQNTVLIMNIDDINIRKTVVHAVNKVPIIESELGDIETPVSQLFPEAAPYCDVDLTPKFDYDLEKAQFLNCPESSSSSKKKSTTRSTVFVALFTTAAVIAVILVLLVCFMVRREQNGQPLFQPLVNPLVENEVEFSKDNGVESKNDKKVANGHKETQEVQLLSE